MTNTQAVAGINLGKLVTDEKNNVPQLEVVGTSIRGEGLHTYYLSPFRGYGFQVSGNITGDGSFGRSEFLGLQHVIDSVVGEALTLEIIRMMVKEALTDFASKNGKIARYDMADEDTIYEFTKASISWVKAL